MRPLQRALLLGVRGRQALGCQLRWGSRARSSVASGGAEWTGSSSGSKWTRSLLPPAAVGWKLTAVDTPALVVRLDALEANVKNMTAHLGALAPSVSIRPHAKSHKTAELAAIQMQQLRHIGICCQKVSEAVAMADTVGDILLTNVIASLPKARKLANLVRRGCGVTVVVDSEASLEIMTAAARAEGVRIGVLIDIDVGQARTGVESPEEAVALAKAVAGVEELQLRGIQAYHGAIQHIRSWSERRAAAADVASKARRVVEAMEVAGIPCEIVSGGGTGTCAFDAASGVFTEVQPGSYIFNDGDYMQNLDASGSPVSLWRQSLFVASTVISRNVAARRAVLDAGMKAVSYDSGPPIAHGSWSKTDAPVAENGGDEHTILHFQPGVELPAVGDQVLLVPGHCDPTINLYDHLVGIRKDTVEEVWMVGARGPGL